MKGAVACWVTTVGAQPPRGGSGGLEGDGEQRILGPGDRSHRFLSNLHKRG